MYVTDISNVTIPSYSLTITSFFWIHYPVKKSLVICLFIYLFIYLFTNFKFDKIFHADHQVTILGKKYFFFCFWRLSCCDNRLLFFSIKPHLLQKIKKKGKLHKIGTTSWLLLNNYPQFITLKVFLYYPTFL